MAGSNRSLCLCLALVVSPGFLTAPLTAATLTIVNNDGPGEGFNDPTAVAPVAGNTATTRGAQRLNAFQAAADAWGAILSSDVTIVVDATMDPLTPCNPGFGVLGSAGPQFVFRDFAAAPLAGTWYHVALANSLAGADLDPGSGDIEAAFNSDVDTNPNCLTGLDWWYGIGAPAPAGTIDFISTVLHEIAHGLGFSSFVNVSTGAKLLGFDDTYMVNLRDLTTGLDWPDMSNAQRMASAINTANLVWTGINADAASSILSSGTNGGFVRMYAPNPVQPGSSVSHWDTVLSPDELMEPSATPSQLQILTNAAFVDEGWTGPIFADGFESGDTSAWSATVP